MQNHSLISAAEPQPIFESDSFTIRMTELDDADHLLKCLEASPQSKSQETSLNLLYNYPNLIALIERSFLSITILDSENHVKGLAIFNDCPQGLRGMIDFQHENYWEYWLFEAFQLDVIKRLRVTSYSSLWMVYYGIDRSMFKENQEREYEHLITKVFQHVYGSLPNIECLLFLYRGEAVSHEEDTKTVIENFFIEFNWGCFFFFFLTELGHFSQF